MEFIKRKINIEPSIDRQNDSPNWGSITANTFYLNISLNQNIDDIGLMTDIDFISKENTNETADYTILIDKLNSSGLSFPFMNGNVANNLSGITDTDSYIIRKPNMNLDDYFINGNLPITANTESSIEDIKTYNNDIPYQIGFNMNSETYVNYNGNTINGVDKLKTLGDESIYVFDTPNDNNLGTPNQVFGLQYTDYSGQTRDVIMNGRTKQIPITKVRYIGEGFNETNTSLSAITKEEFLFGIISKPEIQNDLFIDRGITSVMDKHLRLSEIKNLESLIKYGNGFYKIKKQ